MNTTELKAAESALEDALDKVRQLIASEPEPEPEPERMVGVPLCEAPHVGAPYWTILSTGEVHKVHWRDSATGHQCLAQGNVFASEREAEFAAKHKAIWAMPIGEWQEDGPYWCAELDEGSFGICVLLSAGHGIFNSWLRGEVAFTDEGKAELERRIAATEALFKDYGL